MTAEQKQARGAVEDTRVFELAIDRSNRIVSVNDAWLAFALENDAADLTRDSVVGHSLFDFICDTDTVHIYRLLLERVRATGDRVTVPFRCDSPDRRRHMQLAIAPRDAGRVAFESWILREEPRSPVAVPVTGGAGAFVKICGWCKKVLVDTDRWLEVEAAMEQLAVFGGDRPAQVTHGMCPACFHDVKSRLTN